MVNQHPKHFVATSAYIENEKGQVLLVKTHFRPDTFELPGGQVEEGEALDQSVIREVFEETGILIQPLGITGVYYNTSMHILSVVFKAEYISGSITPEPEEIKEAVFAEVNTETIARWITRPHMQSRTLDAQKAQGYIPYETWETAPYNRLGRLEEAPMHKAADPGDGRCQKE